MGGAAKKHLADDFRRHLVFLVQTDVSTFRYFIATLSDFVRRLSVRVRSRETRERRFHAEFWVGRSQTWRASLISDLDFFLSRVSGRSVPCGYQCLLWVVLG